MKLTGEKGVLPQFLLDCEGRLMKSSLRFYHRRLALVMYYLGEHGVLALEEVKMVDLRIANMHTRYVKVLGKGLKEYEVGVRPDVSWLLWLYIQRYWPSDVYPVKDRVLQGREEALTVEGIEQVFRRVATPVVSSEKSGRKSKKCSPHPLQRWLFPRSS
jgi:site-specific recombinase XerC